MLRQELEPRHASSSPDVALTQHPCLPTPFAPGDASGAPPAQRETAEGFNPDDPANQEERTALRERDVHVRRKTGSYTT